MATPKTWTATDLELGKLVIYRAGTNLHVERRYQFVDAGGAILDQIAGGRVVEEIAISAVPANILSALEEIDTWTKTKALQQEGMM